MDILFYHKESKKRPATITQKSVTWAMTVAIDQNPGFQTAA